jgi:hypothetical protein
MLQGNPERPDDPPKRAGIFQTISNLGYEYRASIRGPGTDFGLSIFHMKLYLRVSLMNKAPKFPGLPSDPQPARGVELRLSEHGVFVHPGNMPTSAPIPPFPLPMLDAVLIENCGAWLRQIWWKSRVPAMYLLYLSTDIDHRRYPWLPHFPPQVVEGEGVRAPSFLPEEFKRPITQVWLAGSVMAVPPDAAANMEERVGLHQGVHVLVVPDRWLSVGVFIRTADQVIPVTCLDRIVQDDRHKNSDLAERLWIKGP